MNSNVETHIFVSYANVSEVTAKLLYEYIEKSGFPCWFAPRDVRKGEHYATELSHALKNSAAVILVLDTNANKSKHVLREVTIAIEKSKPIFVVQFGDFSLSEGLDYLLSGIQRICVEQEAIENSVKILIDQLSKTVPWVRKNRTGEHQSIPKDPFEEIPPDEWDFTGKLPFSKWLKDLFKDKK